jgi:hypothetical protein
MKGYGMKKSVMIGGLVIAGLGVSAYVAFGGSGTSSKVVNPVASASVTPQPTASAASQRVLPVSGGNPIVNASQVAGFIIKSAIAENNIDPISKKIVTDHLEVTLTNVSAKDISQFEVFYNIKDVVTNVSDSYFSKLSGFVLKAGETKAFHFDNTGQPGHYPENNYSLYRTTKNAMQIDITVSAPLYKVETVSIKKDKGGTEKVD